MDPDHVADGPLQELELGLPAPPEDAKREKAHRLAEQLRGKRHQNAEQIDLAVDRRRPAPTSSLSPQKRHRQMPQNDAGSCRRYDYG
jgi:hypothetical protein